MHTALIIACVVVSIIHALDIRDIKRNHDDLRDEVKSQDIVEDIIDEF